MTEQITHDPVQDKPKVYEQRWFWPVLGWALVLVITVSTYLIIVYASNPFNAIVPTMFFLIGGLAVVAFLATRRGYLPHFMAIAVLLPFLFGAALYQGSLDRLKAELEDFGNDLSQSVEEEPLLGESPFPDPSEAPLDGEDAGPAQPIDGGTYTWASGVTMALKITKIEPWGSKDDYCGDGSCGISNPDDMRVVLHYDVSVPDGDGGAFDPSSCPGDLYLKDGGDDNSIISVSGQYAHDIDGKIFPGGSKSGDKEYSIEKDFKGAEFYFESSCGDVNMDGETAYFEGVIG